MLLLKLVSLPIKEIFGANVYTIVMAFGIVYEFEQRF